MKYTDAASGNTKIITHWTEYRHAQKETELLWIFFGIHTANALETGRRIAASKAQKKRA